MEQIINPIGRHLLRSELSSEKLLRMSSRGNNEIYVVDGESSPAVMKEIGRLRELAFRNCGGGTGKSVDIDDFDLIPGLYRQLIVWSPEEEAILGGYRYSLGLTTPYRSDGQPLWASSDYFRFSEEFIRTIMPYAIELGRSFVSPEYQSSRSGARSIFALDNLWDGLMTIIVNNPDLRYFFGKMTMYNQYCREARNLILFFLKMLFPCSSTMVEPKYPVSLDSVPDSAENDFRKENFNEAYRVLKREIHNLGEHLPPLVNSYMKLTDRMQVFGTSHNMDFGNVEETAILIDIYDVAESTLMRHITSAEFMEWQAAGNNYRRV